MNKLVKLSLAVLLLASVIAWYQPNLIYSTKDIHEIAAKFPALVSLFKWYHTGKGSDPKAEQGSSKDGPQVLAEPTRIFTKEELAKYKGEDGGDIYLALMGKVFDVTRGRDYYGPGGGYAFFSGKEKLKIMINVIMDYLLVVSM